MPKFEFFRGKMRSLESIAYLKAIEAGEEPVVPADSIQPPPRVADISAAELDELAADAAAEADAPLTRGQKAAATRAANKEAKIRQEAAKAEPLRPQNIDPATGNPVTIIEAKGEDGEVKQIVLPPADQTPVIGPDGETESDIEGASAVGDEPVGPIAAAGNTETLAQIIEDHAKGAPTAADDESGADGPGE